MCRFDAHYHPQMPCMGTKVSMLADARENKVLLWAIVNAASRSFATHRHLRKEMAWPIRRLAVENSMRSLPNLALVQALLLLCLWTPSYTSQSDDPSWMLCGIATHKALQLGLHRSGFDHEFMSLSEQTLDYGAREARRRTWLACFIVNERFDRPLTRASLHWFQSG